MGNREAIEFIPFEGHTEREVGEAAFLSSWADDTPEGRSIIRLAYDKGFVPGELNALALSETYEFSASTRTSGVKITEGRVVHAAEGRVSGGRFRRKSSNYATSIGGRPSPEADIEIIKGSPDAVKAKVARLPRDYDVIVDGVASAR